MSPHLSPRAAIVVLIVAALAGLSVAAQDSPQDLPPIDLTRPSVPRVFRAETTAQVVAVSVLDDDRRPVRGLAADDFIVLENGTERPVIGVVEVDLSNPIERTPTAPAAADTPVPLPAFRDPTAEGRLIVIVFDRTILAASQPLARQAAHTIVDALGSRDLAAVLFTAVGHEAQGFTSDRDLLRAAIDQPLRPWPEPGLDGGPERGNPGECYCGLCGPETITRVAEVLAAEPTRRKLLVFIGREPAIDDWWYRPTETPWQQPLGRQLGGDLYRLNCRPEIARARERLVATMAASNLTVYTVNPDGIETATVTASSSVRGRGMIQAQQQFQREGITYRRDARFTLAKLGNGRTFESNNGADVRAIFEETETYYLLGFEPLPPTPGEDDTLSIEVREGDYTVLAPETVPAGPTGGE